MTTTLTDSAEGDVVTTTRKTTRARRATRVVPHLTVAERVARGRAARSEMPRSRHAEYAPGAHRADPVALLESQAESRVPELVPIRYGRMLVSPFTFYRGAALLMAADLASSPHSGLHAQLCGDAHLSNFGLFAAPDRRLVFDLNDFDETLPGPWEWDLKRLAVSFEVAGRENGYTRKQRRAIVQETVAGVSAGDAAVRRHARAGRVVRPARGRRVHGAAARPAEEADGKEGREDRGEGPDEGQHDRVLQAHPDGGR